MINPLENCLLLLGLPAVLVLAGYWLVARLDGISPAERLAAAVLGGLCVLLWEVSVVACFVPIAGFWAWLCLWPLAATLLWPHSRRALLQDASEILTSRRCAVGVGVVVIFFLLSLWPLLTTPGLVYYDGTANHDGFLWVAGAEHLKRHTYWEMPVVTATHPFAHTAGAIVGWRPFWGRIGAEGLLALASSIVGLAPVKLYVSATAALYYPWLAAVYLVVRTFFAGRLTTAGFIALLGVQPLFVFFHANANLPNLVGAIVLGLVVTATERSLHATTRRIIWLVMLALSVHALLCSYPDMWPFAALPAGLLWLRGAFKRQPAGSWRPALLTLAALVSGTLLNPASTVRAWNGFLIAYSDASLHPRYNLFGPLSGAEFLPALLTLSVPAAKDLGMVIAAGLTMIIAPVTILTVRRARDPWGVIMILAGCLLLGAYTLCTGFNYGWQKSVQFAGPIVAALLPVAAVNELARESRSGRNGWIVRCLLAAVLAFTGYATVRNALGWHKEARRKFINRDWFDLREYVRTERPDGPILIEGASFDRSFFHTMWATYFLADTPIYFGARGEQNGGYVRDTVANEGVVPVPPEATVLVSRDWADGFDANSERLFTSNSLALLREANRVTELSGFLPGSGQPRYLEDRAAITVTPHSASQLSLTLSLAPETMPDADKQVRWRARIVAGEGPAQVIELASTPPWRFALPLVPHVSNRIELTAENSPPAGGKLPPFVVVRARIESQPRP